VVVAIFNKNALFWDELSGGEGWDLVPVVAIDGIVVFAGQLNGKRGFF
jgi:hypothetical protein